MKTLVFVFAVMAVSCTLKEKHSDNTNSKVSQMESQSTEIRIVKPADLKTDPEFTTSVISNAQKFIIPVPAFKDKGEPLVYPKDHAKAGQAIVDYKGKPVGDKGIVFFNFIDKSLQAAPGDGKAVIIINEVTRERALKLDQEIKKIKSDPENLSLMELKQVISYAHDRLNLGDMYNSTRSFVEQKMTPVLSENVTKKKEKIDPVYGFKKRDDKDVSQAIYISGEFVFEGPAATPQKFKDGGVIVIQDGKMRGVQPDIFLRTYQLADGNPIQSLFNDIRSQLR